MLEFQTAIVHALDQSSETHDSSRGKGDDVLCREKAGDSNTQPEIKTAVEDLQINTDEKLG